MLDTVNLNPPSVLKDIEEATRAIGFTIGMRELEREAERNGLYLEWTVEQDKHDVEYICRQMTAEAYEHDVEWEKEA